MADRKTYTRSQQIGDEGEAFIGSLVTRTGHIWHPRNVDHGIDGEVELVDLATRRPLNVHLLVQSKAKAGRFSSETDSTFHLNVTAADIQYWNEASDPVVVICSRPASSEAWWAPATRAMQTSGRSWRIDFDKTLDRLDEQSGPALLAYATRSTGTTAVTGPDPRTERLETNLLTVATFPDQIYVAPTWKPSARELGPALRERGFYRSDWIVREGMVFTFTRPDAAGLGAFTDGGIEALDTEEWAESKDPEIQHRFVDLLRQALRDQEHRDLRFHPKKRYFYFVARTEGEPRVIKLGRGKGRAVVQPYFKDSGELKDHRHVAAELPFVRTDMGWAAQITPTYHFTFDGRRDLPWGADRLKGIKKLERNQAVRSMVRFWARYLSRPTELGAPQPAIQFDRLIELMVDQGIDDDAWQEARASASDPIPEVDDQLELLS